MTQDKAPIQQAHMICHLLRASRFGGIIYALHPEKRTSMESANAAIDKIIARWEKLIAEHSDGDAKLPDALKRYYDEQRRKKEDAIIAHADAIKARRAAGVFSS